jgi:hypothetical protein
MSYYCDFVKLRCFDRIAIETPHITIYVAKIHNLAMCRRELKKKMKVCCQLRECAHKKNEETFGQSLHLKHNNFVFFI